MGYVGDSLDDVGEGLGKLDLDGSLWPSGFSQWFWLERILEWTSGTKFARCLNVSLQYHY
jgi:hypothetical protein